MTGLKFYTYNMETHVQLSADVPGLRTNIEVLSNWSALTWGISFSLKAFIYHHTFLTIFGNSTVQK